MKKESLLSDLDTIISELFDSRGSDALTIYWERRLDRTLYLLEKIEEGGKIGKQREEL